MVLGKLSSTERLAVLWRYETISHFTRTVTYFYLTLIPVLFAFLEMGGVLQFDHILRRMPTSSCGVQTNSISSILEKSWQIFAHLFCPIRGRHKLKQCCHVSEAPPSGLFWCLSYCLRFVLRDESFCLDAAYPVSNLLSYIGSYDHCHGSNISSSMFAVGLSELKDSPFNQSSPFSCVQSGCEWPSDRFMYPVRKQLGRVGEKDRKRDM